MTKNTSSNIKIIYEDKNLLVIDKPTGLIAHPNIPGQKNTLTDWLIARFPEIIKVGDDPLRPGVVHRLDKDTSGLMIIAKNNFSFEFFKKQFQERKIEKTYTALAVGKIKEEKGIISKAISLSKKDRRKRSALLDEKAKKAQTRYNVIKKYKEYSLLKVKPLTGRTHQIRVHLSSIGHPVAGDKQYKIKRKNPPNNLSRQFLHASYLKFHSPDNKLLKIKSELPKDLKEVLERLEKNE